MFSFYTVFSVLYESLNIFEAFKILEAIIIPPLDGFKAVKNIGSYMEDVSDMFSDNLL